MSEVTENKVKRFMRCVIREVASQALPNWVQVALALGHNFHQIFIVGDQRDQQQLLEASARLSESEWLSIRQVLLNEQGDEYAQAVDRVRELLARLAENRTQVVSERQIRRAIDQTLLRGTDQTFVPRASGR